MHFTIMMLRRPIRLSFLLSLDAGNDLPKFEVRAGFSGWSQGFRQARVGMGFQDAAVVPKRSQVCRSFLRLQAAGNHLRLEPIRQGHHPFQGARGLKHLREREFDRADKSKSHGWISESK